MKKIIFNYNENLCVMTPYTACGLTVEEIAKKDVPMGVKYKIVDESALPESWDEKDYDGVGGE